MEQHIEEHVSQPRSQGLFSGFGAGREKTLASAGHVRTLHNPGYNKLASLHNQKYQNQDDGETVCAKSTWIWF